VLNQKIVVTDVEGKATATFSGFCACRGHTVRLVVRRGDATVQIDLSMRDLSRVLAALCAQIDGHHTYTT